MPQQTPANRIANLERKVERLEELPRRVSALELQISQFRDEVRVEFSAVRGEMRGLGVQLREEMRGGMQSLAETLRAEIREGDEETRR
jgi:hypothetical protein